jgi:hypothetical protein
MSAASGPLSEQSSVRARSANMSGPSAKALVLALVAGAAVLMNPAPSAQASDSVTYEIVSDSIPTVDVEYVDQSGRRLVTGVTLPWRLDAVLDNPQGQTGPGAQLRADWRRIRGPAKWVTVRIYQGAQLLCQSTLDVGNATCYGNTPHVS